MKTEQVEETTKHKCFFANPRDQLWWGSPVPFACPLSHSVELPSLAAPSLDLIIEHGSRSDHRHTGSIGFVMLLESTNQTPISRMAWPRDLMTKSEDQTGGELHFRVHPSECNISETLPVTCTSNTGMSKGRTAMLYPSKKKLHRFWLQWNSLVNQPNLGVNSHHFSKRLIVGC